MSSFLFLRAALAASLVSCAFALALPFSTRQTSSSPSVTLGSTVVTGSAQTFDGVGVDFFGGIPFAEPPVGSLRFMPPVAKDLSGSSFDATAFGPACAQFNFTGNSEDCLTVNVFRPSGTSGGDALPVMVWIYGGGFTEGGSSTANATAIIVESVARGTPVVFVSLNYRVGPFGFPQGDEAASRSALNLGLKDQLTALKWVQRYVSVFGGDSSKVTVFGQSAGSISIADLYLNSGLESLVRGAIMESGSTGTIPFYNASRRNEAWLNFTAGVSECADAAEGDSFSCLQSASTSELIASWAQAATTLTLTGGSNLFVPVIDGDVIPDLPSKLFAAGKFSKIPFMAGTVLDEGTFFIPQTVESQEELAFLFSIAELPFGNTSALPSGFQTDLGTLLTLYPDDPAVGSPFGTGNETFGLSSQFKRASALLGDVSFQAPRRAWIQAAASAGVTTYGYLFADQNAVTEASLGVTHASEVSYVFGGTAVSSDNASVKFLSKTMVDYWLSFVVSGSPNDGKGSSRTTWPAYTTSSQNLIQFDTTSFSNTSFAEFSIIPDTYRQQQISFINSVHNDLAQ